MATRALSIVVQVLGTQVPLSWTMHRLDTSLNKVSLKLNWSKTTVKLNPLPGLFHDVRQGRGCKGPEEGVRKGLRSHTTSPPTNPFSLRFTHLIFLFLPRYWKSPSGSRPFPQFCDFRARARGCCSLGRRKLVYFVLLPNTIRDHQHLISRLIAHRTNFVWACFLSPFTAPPTVLHKTSPRVGSSVRLWRARYQNTYPPPSPLPLKKGAKRKLNFIQFEPTK
jgi:hypothetical protein